MNLERRDNFFTFAKILVIFEKDFEKERDKALQVAVS